MARPRLRLLEGEPAPVPAIVAGAPLGRLHVVGGPLSEQAFSVGSTPLSIGSGARCLIRLPQRLEDGSEISQEFARIWVRDNRLMLHELRRLTASGPVGGRWELLEDGDSFSIGPCSFRFQLGMSDESPAAPAEPVPDVLRGAPRSLDADLELGGSEPTPIEVMRSTASEPPATPPDQPIPDIFKSRPSEGTSRDAQESTEESPPQAAAAP
jgi:hypothetical protein